MVLDYSKWDALELSDDSDIEVHPNVDKRSFIRAKQNQIHQERFRRRHQIDTLKYERVINDGLLTRIDRLIGALQQHSTSTRNADEVVFQLLVESVGDPAEDHPPPRPEGVHSQVDEQPTYSKMMATLVDQVKKEVDETKSGSRYEEYLKSLQGHQTKVRDLQSELLTRLAELEKEEGRKITSENIHTGFDRSSVSKGEKKSSTESSKTGKTTAVEVLNPGALKKDPLARMNSVESGAEADEESGAGGGDDDDDIEPTKLGKDFAKIKMGDYRACLQFIQEHPSVVAERETDGLLVEAFNSQIAGKDTYARQCVHQALLLQYCRSLGRDGVGLFFKRITTRDHQAQKVFLDDVQSTYARIRTRAGEIAAERAADAASGAGVEQIQLHAVEPGTTINIVIPQPGSDEPVEQEARKTFETFPPGLQRALESGSLDEVNKVLGKMSVEEAEEVVGQLGESGMLSMEEQIIDATTAEGQEKMKQLEALEREREQQDTAMKSMALADDPE
ncbi:MAG: hsp90 co-chaperone Cdc37 [Thelocarpon superellum]|nr:MAG: hsp90 co-chaperone Cdc37 [Thelocarpon superellum]